MSTLFITDSDEITKKHWKEAREYYGIYESDDKEEKLNKVA